MKDLKATIRTVPDWPKKGIMFRDITTLLKDPEAFNQTIDILCEHYRGADLDLVAGIEARGFIIGSALAHALHLGFVPIRKKGKLPAQTASQEYDLEYGKDVVEIHKDAISPGMRVLVADDLLATGGTALAACKLIESLGGKIVECCFVISLPDLGGGSRLEKVGFKVHWLIEFEGD